MPFKYILIFIGFFSPLISEENEFTCKSHIIKNQKIYKYPYDDLAQELKEQGIETLKIFSYGSLMSVKSAKKTFSNETMKTRKPAIAFGIKRVFNRDIPIEPDSHWGIPFDPNARGMLNVLYTNEDTDFVNGIVFEVKASDLEPMGKREIGYDLIPVKCIDWEASLTSDDPPNYIAYTFHARIDSKYTNSKILPRPGYYELSRDASKEHGLLFYLLWLKTTYLADGTTPITQWEDWLCENKPFTQIKKPAPAE